MFKEPTGKQEKGKGETEEKKVGVGGVISISYTRITLELTRPFSEVSSLSAIWVHIWGGDKDRNPPGNSTELFLRTYSGLVNACTGNHGRLFSKPAG